jgi:hypothetical protein
VAVRPWEKGKGVVRGDGIAYWIGVNLQIIDGFIQGSPIRSNLWIESLPEFQDWLPFSLSGKPDM